MNEQDRAALQAMLDRAVEAIAGEFSAFRAELTARLETIERRFDNQLNIVLSIGQRMSGLTRWSDRVERDTGAYLLTQAAQQRAIDQLTARLKALEEGHRAQ
jgi:hypothetical protein